MRPKTVILMIVAVSCGLAASFLTSRFIAEHNSQAEVEKVSVLVARRNVGMGTLLNEPERFFEEKLFTRGEEPKKAVRGFEDLKGRRLNKQLAAEQFVTADDLIGRDQELPLAPGTVAMALNVNARDGVGGFIQPQSHVNIVSVINGNNGETIAKTILQKILVLAVDQNVDRPDGGKAIVANTVTVQVTPEQAQRLALAQKMGSLSLVLRPFDDDTRVTLRPATTKDVIQDGGDKSDGSDLVSDDRNPRSIRLPVSVPEVPAVLPTLAAESKSVMKVPSKVHTLVIYNGKELTNATFPLGDEEETSSRIEKSRPDQEPAAQATPRSLTP